MRGEFTGRHMLVVTLGAFGVIIAVNLVMATLAIGTFPGKEVDNSFVASQTFDAARKAQTALGWTVAPSYADGVLRIAVTGRDGQPAPVGTLTATVGRPTLARDDVTPAFARRGGVFTAPVALAPGPWILTLRATAPDGTVFRQRIDAFPGSRVR